MSSNVIKPRTLEPISRPSVVKREVQIACAQANEILARAHNEAQQIVSEARQDAQNILDSAREDGYQRGAMQWSEVLADAWNSRDSYLAANETALLQLAVRIAGKLIGEELRTSPDAVAAIVKEALRSVRRAKTLIIQVHPGNTDLVRQRLSSLRAHGAAVQQIEIVPNASLSPGDCIIETEIGSVDARLETQLKNLERVLTLKMAT